MKSKNIILCLGALCFMSCAQPSYVPAQKPCQCAENEGNKTMLADWVMKYLPPEKSVKYSSQHVEQLTPQNFDEKVLESKLPAIVDFYTDWCVWCKKMEPIYEEVCKNHSTELKCFAYDAEQKGAINPANEYFIQAFPTYVFFSNGKEAKEFRIEGAMSKEELEDIVKKFLKKAKTE